MSLRAILVIVFVVMTLTDCALAHYTSMINTSQE